VKILLVGPQGSGKSTQAKLLAEYLGLPTVETGQIFRDLADNKTELGMSVKARLKKGEMIDDETTARLLEARLAQSDCQKGFIVTGYPRSMEQLEALDIDFDRVFSLVVSDEEVIDRMLKRGRMDDSREAIEKRLVHYHKETEPVLEHYQKLGLVTDIEGVGEVDDIQSKLRSKLNGQD
jgi:adenylate kinase